MKTFTDLGVFGAFLIARVKEAEDAAQLGLKDAAEIIEENAKARIAHYQSDTGPFNAWAPLAPSTLEGWAGHPGKVALGFAPPDNPLLREGNLRSSYGFTLERDKVTIGSDSQIALDQELGTPNSAHPIPPRPVIGPAAFAKVHEAVGAISKAFVDSLAGLPYTRVRPGDQTDIPF